MPDDSQSRIRARECEAELKGLEGRLERAAREVGYAHRQEQDLRQHVEALRDDLPSMSPASAIEALIPPAAWLIDVVLLRPGIAFLIQELLGERWWTEIAVGVVPLPIILIEMAFSIRAQMARENALLPSPRVAARPWVFWGGLLAGLFPALAGWAIYQAVMGIDPTSARSLLPQIIAFAALSFVGHTLTVLLGDDALRAYRALALYCRLGRSQRRWHEAEREVQQLEVRMIDTIRAYVTLLQEYPRLAGQPFALSLTWQTVEEINRLYGYPILPSPSPPPSQPPSPQDGDQEVGGVEEPLHPAPSPPSSGYWEAPLPPIEEEDLDPLGLDNGRRPT